jgi:DNA-directed RNA polymerase subunit M/transcription elongation factor TFIIS
MTSNTNAVIQQVISEYKTTGPSKFIFSKSQALSIREGRRYEQWEVDSLGRKEEYVKGLRCIYCKSETVIYFIDQTRRADENATTTFECRSCNQSWKK